MQISKTIKYVGVFDTNIDLFEGQYKVPDGISYNSYVIIDEKIAVMDTVDAKFGGEWLENLKRELGNKSPDYLVVQHMEPDHSANIVNKSNTILENNFHILPPHCIMCNYYTSIITNTQ